MSKNPLWDKYSEMIKNGAGPEDIYRVAYTDTGTKFAAIGYIRDCFDLGLEECRRICDLVEKANSPPGQ